MYIDRFQIFHEDSLIFDAFSFFMIQTARENEISSNETDENAFDMNAPCPGTSREKRLLAVGTSKQ